MDTDRIEGKAKEIEGKVTDDESREAEGRLQKKWGDAKDSADDTWEKAKDKVGGAINEHEEREEREDEAERS
jgi:uncharacterized protein YjbJ (UPF0337 family)